MTRNSRLIAALTLLLLSSSLQAQSQDNLDLQRCNGDVAASAQDQIASCSTLISSGNFSGQVLAVIYSNRAVLTSDQADYKAAIADFDQALALDPTNAQSLYDRGLAKLKSGDDNAGGNADIAQARQMNPQLAAVDESAFGNAAQTAANPATNLPQALASAMRAPVCDAQVVQDNFSQYSSAQGQKAFALSCRTCEVFGWVAERTSVDDAAAAAVKECEDSTNGDRCRLYAINDVLPRRNRCPAPEPSQSSAGQTTQPNGDQGAQPDDALSALLCMINPQSCDQGDNPDGDANAPGNPPDNQADNPPQNPSKSKQPGKQASNQPQNPTKPKQRPPQANNQPFPTNVACFIDDGKKVYMGFKLPKVNQNTGNATATYQMIGGALPPDNRGTITEKNCNNQSTCTVQFCMSGTCSPALPLQQASLTPDSKQLAALAPPLFGVSAQAKTCLPPGNPPAKQASTQPQKPAAGKQPGTKANNVTIPLPLLCGIDNGKPFSTKTNLTEDPNTGTITGGSFYTTGGSLPPNSVGTIMAQHCAAGSTTANNSACTLEFCMRETCSPPLPMTSAAAGNPQLDALNEPLFGVSPQVQPTTDCPATQPQKPTATTQPGTKANNPPVSQICLIDGKQKVYINFTNVNLNQNTEVTTAQYCMVGGSLNGKCGQMTLNANTDCHNDVACNMHFCLNGTNGTCSTPYVTEYVTRSMDQLGAPFPPQSQTELVFGVPPQATDCNPIGGTTTSSTNVPSGGVVVATPSPGVVPIPGPSVPAFIPDGGGPNGGGSMHPHPQPSHPSQQVSHGQSTNTAKGQPNICPTKQPTSGSGKQANTGNSPSGSPNTAASSHIHLSKPGSSSASGTSTGSPSSSSPGSVHTANTASGGSSTTNATGSGAGASSHIHLSKPGSSSASGTSTGSPSSSSSGSVHTANTASGGSSTTNATGSGAGTSNHIHLSKPGSSSASGTSTASTSSSPGAVHTANTTANTATGNSNSTKATGSGAGPGSKTGAGGSSGPMVRQRTTKLSPPGSTSSGQTNHGNANTQSTTSHGSSAGANRGNQRTVSRTPSNQKSFSSNRSRSTSHRVSRNRPSSSGHARTTYRPARVASHSSGGNRRRSDIRLKADIVALTRLDNGIGIYRFRYKGNDHTAYVGVMAQEVAKVVPDAVTRGRDGYLSVDYDRLGLEFMTWDDWMARRDAKSGLVQ